MAFAVHSLRSCVWRPWLPLLQMSCVECMSHFPNTCSAFRVPCSDVVGKFCQFCCSGVGPLCPPSHQPSLTDSCRPKSGSEVNRLFFVMKPVSWGNGANGKREIVTGTCEQTEAAFGVGEKEAGREEGGQGCRRSEWLGRESRGLRGQEDKRSIALLSGLARSRFASAPEGRPASGETVWVQGCSIGLSMLLPPRSPCETWKAWW